MEVSGQLHAPVGLPMRKASSGTHWIRGWAGSTFGRDALEKKINLLPLLEVEARILGRSAGNFSRYVHRLRTSGFITVTKTQAARKTSVSGVTFQLPYT